MNSSLKAIFKWVVFLAILFTLANEIGRIGITYYNSSSLADQIAQGALNAYYQHRSLAAARYTAQKMANQNGVIFNDLSFQERPPKMFVNITVPVQGTWIIQHLEITKPYTAISLQGEAEPSY